MIAVDRMTPSDHRNDARANGAMSQYVPMDSFDQTPEFEPSRDLGDHA